MTERHYVLVGIGDDDHGPSAIQWAAREAQARGVPLRAVRCYFWTVGAVPWETETEPGINQMLRDSANRRVESITRQVKEQFPDVDFRGEVFDGDPKHALVDLSADAIVTVLGSRNLGGVGAVVLGSVSTTVASSASSPVVVIEGEPGVDREAPAVVAGLDGGPNTDRVLGFSFDFASRHRRPLRTVFCWPRDALAESGWRLSVAPERADRWLAEATAGWQEKYPDVTVQRIVTRDRVVDGLIAESLSQELLVVGAHAGRSRLGNFLGSTSQGVLHHARCPVAVVH